MRHPSPGTLQGVLPPSTLEVGLWPCSDIGSSDGLGTWLQPPSHHLGGLSPALSPWGRPRDIVSVPLEAERQTSAQLRIWSWSLCGPCLPSDTRNPPPVYPWCQACSAQTHTCGLEVDAHPAPPLLTEDPEAGLPTLAPDRICVCPDPSHRHAGADISIHSALGETWGAGGTGCTRDPVTPALGRGPGLEQLRPTVQAGPGQQRTALGAPCAPHLQTSHRGVG